MGKTLSRKPGTQQAQGRSLNSSPSGCMAGFITMPDSTWGSVVALGCAFWLVSLKSDSHESANLDNGGWLLLLSESPRSRPRVTVGTNNRSLIQSAHLLKSQNLDIRPNTYQSEVITPVIRRKRKHVGPQDKSSRLAVGCLHQGTF